jgi:predicted outer membrane protein
MLAAAGASQAQSIKEPAVFAQTMTDVNHLAIASAELALKRAKTEGARDYANRAMKEHKEMQAELDKAAKAEGVTLKPELNADFERKRAALANANAAQFDAAYLSNEIVVQQAAHEATKAYSESGPGGDLKTFAVNYRNTYMMHLVRARSLTNVD